MLYGVLIVVACAASAPFPETFEHWAQGRVGPVVFPEGSSHTWDEFTGFARELCAQAVKTWIGARKPGEAFAAIQTEPYRNLIRTFRTVHFNISPSYVADGYAKGKIVPEMLEAVRREWHDIALFLCRARAFPDQTFLLSVGGEINVYLGTKSAYPDFPVSEYVDACHAGKEAALAELPAEQRARVFSVAELQGDIEFDAFAERWVPTFGTDLVSL
ncbi:MAG: hypothetical protein NTU83_10745, partial [Candidatus Hydrogenedentes bacterium]|nr:hypothetical protein [Candidatus Hydrogenedentota bacterium]